MNKKTKAMLLMIVCAVLWSTAGIFIKLINWNPFIISGLRGLISAGVLAVYMKSQGIHIKVRKNSIMAAIGLGGSATLFTVANKLTTAANAIVLQFTNPVFILIIFAVFFGRKLKRYDIITVIVIMAGIALFFFDQLTPGRLAGNLLGIGAGILLAVMYVFTGESGEDDDLRMTGVLFAHLLCFVIGIPFMVIYTPEAVTMTEILAILALGIFQLGLAYVLYCIASKDCKPLACSLIGALEPLLNPVWVFIFDGEAPGIFALTGGAVVIATICIWCVLDSRNEVKTE